MNRKYCIGVLFFSLIISSLIWAKAPEEKTDARLEALEADIVELQKTNDNQNSDIRHLISDLTAAVNKIGLHENSITALQTDLTEAQQKIALLETDAADLIAYSDDVGKVVFDTMSTQMKGMAAEFGLFEKVFSKRELDHSDIVGVIFPNLDDLIAEMEAVEDNPILHKLDIVEKWMEAKVLVEQINQRYADHVEFGLVDPDELNLMWRAVLEHIEEITGDLSKESGFDLALSMSDLTQATTAAAHVAKKNHDHQQSLIGNI